jgi:hypothetical protein
MNHNRKSVLVAGIILAGIIFTLLLCGCIENEPEAVTYNPMQTTTSEKNATSTIKEPTNITIKVVKFEPSRPCQSCKKLGDYAKETIELYFAEEYKSGKISYQTVNYQDHVNMDMIKKYGISSSSLFITVIKDGEEETINANDMWSYVGNKEEYLEVFKNKLEEILKGY